MAFPLKKPAPWAWHVGAVDPLWYEALGNAYVFPMFEPAPHRGVGMYGKARGVATPMSSTLPALEYGTPGRGAKFVSANTADGLSVANFGYNLTKFSWVAVLEFDTNDTRANYYEHIGARGSIFANGSNFFFGSRQKSGSLTELFMGSRSTGGTLRGGQSGNESHTTLGEGQPYTVWGGTRGAGATNQFYVQGSPAGFDNTWGNGVFTGSTYPLTIGSGDGHSSTSSTCGHRIYAVLIAEDEWTDEQHAIIARHPFGWQERKIWSLPAAGGGTTYNETIAETFSFVDADSRVGTFARTLAEAVSLVDSASSQSTLNRVLAESLAFTDTATGDTAKSESLAESLALTDSATYAATYVRTVSETLSFVDSATRSAIFARAIGEALSLIDSASGAGGQGVIAATVGGQSRTLAQMRRMERQQLLAMLREDDDVIVALVSQILKKGRRLN